MARFEVVRALPTPSALSAVGNVRLPTHFTVLLSEQEDGDPDVEVVFEVRNGAPQCREVHLRATADGHEVRYSNLAAIRIQDVLEKAVKHLALGGVTEVGAGEYRIGARPEPEAQRAAWKAARETRKALKGKAPDLAEVASVYRRNVHNHPTEAVAMHFEVAHRTAGLYIKRAREAGHLGPAIPGKAGERE